eukprot:CAMPEP_0170519826 /NCGR_PEP_ID=MMETSP0209-20121228/5096_1 /TAXON_ID=665100 ORGANISM="Litonotus pictus, Strain P1" /NCGR_SAMPLE_ID=MMETSP0209 /ASSEMBLY_ACC=CAM_ASM_000301 /LENGTH=515 /DNA_ID=CAMNT_0010805803 /DNA_START=1337 /DNA_END=2881 /DNA_ORIENTATION=+
MNLRDSRITQNNGMTDMTSSQLFGRSLNFFKFLRIIFSLSANGFDIKLDFLDNYEKLCLFFERMENSEGFVKIQKKMFLSSKKVRSFQLPEEVVNTLQLKVKEHFSYVNNFGPEINKQKYDYKAVRSSLIDSYEFSLFEIINSKYYDSLQEVFSYFCCFYGNSSSANTTKMKFLLFEKLLKEASLTSTHINKEEHGKFLTSYEIEKIFTRLVNSMNNETKQKMSSTYNVKTNLNFNDEPKVKGNSSKVNFRNTKVFKGSGNNGLKEGVSNKSGMNKQRNIISSYIEFNQFINALELIAIILYGENEPMTSVDFLVENNIVQLVKKIADLHKSEFNILEYYEDNRKNNEEFIVGLNLLHKTMIPYFNYYSKDKSYLEMDSLKRMLIDFSVFPELISIFKIKLFFKQCISKELSENINKEVLDINSLIDFISLCSFEVPFKEPQPNALGKLIFLLQKISQSPGMKKVILNMGISSFVLKKENTDILNNFKQHFPHYFEYNSENESHNNGGIYGLKSG